MIYDHLDGTIHVVQNYVFMTDIRSCSGLLQQLIFFSCYIIYKIIKF